MILADTSVWVDHLRSGDDELAARLTSGSVVMHPWIIGELALGNLRQRESVLSTLGELPGVTVASDDEVLQMIEHHGLSGLGIGYVDVHLLASTMLSAPLLLWTRDRRLMTVATMLGVAAGLV